MGPKKVPFIVTHDGRTIRFPHPDLKKNDTIRLNIKTGEVVGTYKFELGSQVMITGGNNIGRVGTICKVEKHEGSYEIIHGKDERGEEFSTRLSNVFVNGTKKPEITVLKRRQKFSIIEERNIRLGIKEKTEQIK